MDIRMKQWRAWLAGIAMAASLCLTANALQPLPYTCGFEPPTYAPGPLPQQGWEAEAGSSVTVQGLVVYEAQSALAIDAGGAVDQLLVPTGGLVWVDGYQLGAPSLDLPDISGLTSGAAIVAFHTSGVLCLNGAGDGTGTWVSTGIPIDGASWYRVTLRLDFGTRTYECYVNGVHALAGMGFLYNTTSQLHGFHASAGDSVAYLDMLTLSAAQPAGLGVPAPGPEPKREFGFNDTEQGWSFLSSFPSPTATAGTFAPAQLGITASQLFAFGFWGSGANMVPTGPDSLYDLSWSVSSDQAVRGDTPWLRLRANTASGQVASVVNIVSPGAGEFAPDTTGRIYRQLFELPAAVANDGFNLSFDLAQFNPDDVVGAEIRLHEVTVLRRVASTFPAGTPVATYTFPADEQGWSFLSQTLVVGETPPSSNVVPGTGLQIQAHSSFFTVAYWTSPASPMGVPPAKILKASLSVSATGITPPLTAPSMRLRLFDATNGYQSVEFQTTPAGDNSASPGAAPLLFPVYMAVPAGQGLDGSGASMTMDQLNIAPGTSDPAAVFTLHSATLSEIL